jgi:hypothetical protein
MFRKALAVLLIVCLQGLSFAGLLATLSFQLNKQYIAAKICENRAKPKLNCLGKCYLKKIEKKAEEQKEANNTVLKDVYFVLASSAGIEKLFAVVHKIRYIPANHNQQHKGWPKRLFHPPGILS